MKERGMLFNGEMVRAILEGRKSQTRRIMKDAPNNLVEFKYLYERGELHWLTNRYGYKISFNCPHGKPGDRLWVRETWIKITDPFAVSEAIQYRDDETKNAKGQFRDGDEVWNFSSDQSKWKWKPSIHMPRWASRITLEITDVRVERVQDISESDAKAEGVNPATMVKVFHPCQPERPSWVHNFKKIWNSVYKNWDENPWVWVIEFKRVEE